MGLPGGVADQDRRRRPRRVGEAARRVEVFSSHRRVDGVGDAITARPSPSSSHIGPGATHQREDPDDRADDDRSRPSGRRSRPTPRARRPRTVTGSTDSATQGVARISITTTPSIQRWSSNPARGRGRAGPATATIGYQASQKTSEIVAVGRVLEVVEAELQIVSPSAQLTMPPRPGATRCARDARRAPARHIAAAPQISAVEIQRSKSASSPDPWRPKSACAA